MITRKTAIRRSHDSLHDGKCDRTAFVQGYMMYARGELVPSIIDTDTDVWFGLTRGHTAAEFDGVEFGENAPRNILAKAIAPALRVTGFRFSKRFRRGDTLYHRAVYAIVDTVAANHAAGMKVEYMHGEKM